MSGKVWLVGAGPGDPGLLTIRGLEVLKRAEVALFDALVGEGVLAMIPEDAERINVGKRSGSHPVPQDEINQILLRKALSGKRVVRLKGGDPFLFGRGGEELELLRENQIPFEIVPGITSALAVPAYNGIPVTHRDFCSSVHIITGHRRKDQELDIPYQALAETGGTLVFLMGISALPAIMEGLLQAGMDPETPAAVLSRGTTASQARIQGTICTLTERCRQAEVRTPAIIVAGEVSALADSFAWWEARPLAGVRAIVTRPKELASRLTSILRDRGAEVLELPSIRTVPNAENDALREAIRSVQMGGYDWIVLTSPSGVRIFFEALFEQSDVRAVSGVRFACIGQGSARELLRYGIRADFVPSDYDGATLGRELAEAAPEGSRMLIPRAAIGNRKLTEELEKAGKHFVIRDIPTYDTRYVRQELADPSLLYAPETYAVFTSASTVRGFRESFPEVDTSAIKALCIGEKTEAAAASCGMKTWVSRQATLESLAERLVEITRGE